MGHRYTPQCSSSVCLTTALSLLILYLDGIHSLSLVSQDVNGRIAVDADAFNGFSHVRRISPRVLHKRAVPVESTFRPAEKGNHLDEISVELPLDSRTEWLDLRLNWDLMSDGYFERYQSNGTDILHRPNAETADLCHYQGKIRGKPSSWAALSTCHGISGVVFDGEHLHHLEPVWNRDSNGSSSNGLSRWETLHYRQGDLRRNHTCDHGGITKAGGGVLDSQSLVDPLKVLSSSKPAAPAAATSDFVDVPSSAGSMKVTSKVKRGVKTDSYHEPFDSNGKSRYVEMVIVVDNKKYRELGSDLKKTVARTKEISNIVNALYAPLNIYIALVGIVVWTEMDEIELTSNGDDTLARFLHYRRERLVKDHPNDNAQLLTAVEFKDGVVGKAMQGPICSYKYSGGVNSDYKAVTGVVATTIAHELGHNFGMAHDNEVCKCPGPTGRCIMSASSSSNRTSHWSSCSLENLAYAFDHGMDYCLRNKPKRLFESPVCGNGFTEEGEECDCGIADSDSCRKNTCCNPNTCTLYPNATCGAGTCCDLSTCHFKAGGTVCRGSSNTCDLPEYCSGESEFCPDDVHKLNGLECETPNGKAYCYEGKCRTHTDQCRLLWGPSGNNSDNLCYQKNINGSQYGNCGYNLITGNYTACQIEDTKCGRLHCRYLHEKLEFGYEPVAQLSSFFVNARGDIHACRSVTVDFGTQDVDPGLVPDGATCGTGKMCVKQKCVSVESIVAPFRCPGGCGSNGVCNSKGHCHCDEGYGGSTCSDSGFGGSVDSGPAIDPYATSIFAKSLYVTFLGFIPLIAIISFYIYYANENFKKLCQRGRAVARPRSRQNNNKPRGNGTVALGPMEISNPSSGPASNNNTKMTTPDDFFGKYKGFSLAPLKQGSENGTEETTKSRSNVNNNSPATAPPASNVRAGSGNSVSSNANTNVYYSPLPTQTINETLVKNHNEKSTIKSYTHSFLPKNMTRVSWAQPIAQPLPANSPGSEDETNVRNDSHLYSNVLPSNGDGPKAQPLSSPDPVNGNKTIEMETDSTTQRASGHDELNRAESGGVSHEKSHRSLSAGLSRIAGALPFVRNSLRNLTAFHHEDSNKNSCSKDGKHGGRKNLEISTPILQPDSIQNSKLHNLVSISKDSDVGKVDDEVDYSKTTGGTKKTSKGRYANVPLIDESPVKTLKNPPTIEEKQPWTKPSSMEKLKSDAKAQERKPVLRAHSMIQPNRNSMHGNNPNYNSLRRSRPSVPPPKPPGAPPPPPPGTTPLPPTSSLPSIPKARSESPPPITNKPKSVLRPTVNGSNISSILKSFGRNNNSTNNTSLRFESPAPSEPKGPAPIAKLDIDPQSPVSPPNNSTGVDNIYDEIKEGKDEPTKVEEKIETLSTGSSESAGGLLSEIIFEIQNRNKESIYNSVDRRKRKKEEALTLAREKPPVAEKKPSQLFNKKPSSPKLSPKFKYKPSVPAQPLSKPVFKDSLSSRSSPSPPVADSSSPSTVFSKLSNLKRSESPTTVSSSSRSSATTTTTKVVPPPSVSPASLLTTLSKPTAVTSPPPAVVSPTPTTSSAKPTCAVNGVPKVTSSPSYVAKINYFSNLGGTKNISPMKPLNSLNSTLADSKATVASSVYAPSNITTPEPSHLSTIRPTYARPYMNNKLAGEMSNENEDSGATSSVRTAGIYAPNTNSEYGTLGRNKGRKVLEEKPPEVKPPTEPLPAPVQQGYKPFNPYLNRPLTFSTFRPNNTSPNSAAKANSSDSPATTIGNSQSAVTSTKAGLPLTNPKAVTVNVCSIKQQPYGTDTTRGVRSPARVAQ